MPKVATCVRFVIVIAVCLAAQFAGFLIAESEIASAPTAAVQNRLNKVITIAAKNMDPERRAVLKQFTELKAELPRGSLQRDRCIQRLRPLAGMRGR